MKTKQQIIEWVRDNLEAYQATIISYIGEICGAGDRARADGARDALEEFASDFEAFLRSHDFPERD